MSGEFNTVNYSEPGGANWVVGSGGELDIESGGALKIAGTDATTRLASLTALTTAEVEVLDGALSTEPVASKAVIADANQKIGLAKLGSAAASASGLLMGVGTSVAPAATSTADAKFIEVRAKTTATSGDNRLAYMRYDIGGAAAGGECLRAFTDLTAAASTAHGAHISLQADDTGYVSGLGVGMRGQLYLGDAAVAAGGTYYGAQAEIYSAGSSSDISGVTKHAVFSVAATGDSTGMATVVNALSFDGTAAADATKMISTVSLAEFPSSSVAVACLVNGTRYYIPMVLASELN